MNILAIGRCYVQLIVLTHLIGILMGAPVMNDIFRTFLFSCWLVFIGFSPSIIYFQGNLRQIYSFLWQNDLHLPTNSSKKNSHHLLMKNLAWGTVLGAWFGAFAIPLDWDRWWQRWPITCLISSTIAAFLSPIVSYVWMWYRQRSNDNKDRE